MLTVMSDLLQVNVHAPGDVRLDAATRPEVGPRDALVRVEACGICGSDVGYVRLGGVAGPTPEPMPIGHELSGVVEQLGSEVHGLAVGARVVVDPLGAGNMIGNGGSEGGFTRQLLVRNAAEGESLVPIPDAMPFEVAALAEPLGVGMQAVNRSGARPGEKVVIFGAGPIGLAALATLCYRGIEDVVVVDLSPRRLEIARALGAREVLNPDQDKVWRRLRELHGTASVLGAPMAGSDVYIEASGASALIGQVIAHAKSNARLSVVGLHRQEVPVNFLVVMMKQLSIVGSMAQPDDWNDMIEMLSRVDLSAMITHRFALQDFQQGLAIAQTPGAGAKVMITLGD
jgi:threonine dehydrogenase-like Zn-dependent dehydrogenase